MDVAYWKELNPVTKLKDLSGKGRLSMSPMTKVAFGTLFSAPCINAGVESNPVTLAPIPLAKLQKHPVPHPISNT